MIAGMTEHPSDSDIAFRAFDDHSCARFFEDRQDIRCGNWQQFDIDNIFTRRGAEEHITEDHVPTNYISISSSPRRIWNIVLKKQANVRQKIAVIDLRVLRRLGIAYGSNTDDLGFYNFNKHDGTGTKFASRHDFLVLGWLPSSSILGILSCMQFEGLLKRSQIDTSLETGQSIRLISITVKN
jgi:hypothetical protein